MANRAYLLAVDNRAVTWSKHPEQEVVAEGINEIPVFWASLFVPSDRQLDRYEGRDGTLEIPNWCADALTAKQRLDSLRDQVAELLDDKTRRIWHQWVDFLRPHECRYFKTNAAEVWDLDPKGYEDHWATLLRAFSDPSPEAISAALRSNGLRYSDGGVTWDDWEETICKLAGADHIRDVPWLAAGLSDAEREAAPPPSGRSLWDMYMAFEKASGMPYAAAELVLVAEGLAFEIADDEASRITPDQLIQGIIRFFDDREKTPEERRADLAERRINSPVDVWRVVSKWRTVGPALSTTTLDESEYIEAPAARTLFGSGTA